MDQQSRPKPPTPDIKQITERVKQEKELYSIDTLVQLQMVIEEEVKGEYSSIIAKGRTERRKVRQSDPKKYLSLIEDEAKQVDKLISGSIKKVIEKAEGNFDTYNNSVKHWSQRDRHFAMLGHIMIEKIRAELKHERDLTKLTPDLLKDMIRYQTDAYPKLTVDVEDPRQKAMLKKFQMIDQTYDKFGFEEEDLRILRKDAPDEETQKLSKQLQEAIQADLDKTFGKKPQQPGQAAPQGPQGQPGQPGQFPQQGHPGQFPPQGQYPPQGQFPPQGQYPPQGQFPPGQYPPQGHFPPGQAPPMSPHHHPMTPGGVHPLHPSQSPLHHPMTPGGVHPLHPSQSPHHGPGHY